MIKNKKTGQMYIGQSKNIERRFTLHCNPSNIDVAIANEGLENFDFSIVEELDNELLLLKQEKFWIDYYNVEEDENHYNVGYGKHSNSLMNLDRTKYTLWNVTDCHYHKENMTKRNRNPNPCRCFAFRFQKADIPIGLFHDFLSVEIISQLVKEAINEIK